MMDFVRSTALIVLAGLVAPQLVFAAGSAELVAADLTGSSLGIIALTVFFIAYLLIISEEAIRLRKSKPIMVAAGIIWLLVGIAFVQQGDTLGAGAAFKHNILEFAELFLFLLAAMTFINTMEERGIFDVLRAWLVNQGFSLRQVFWVTGGIAFLMSPVADNLATALLMATVAISVGGSNHRFIALACINIVVAANAGGAFSPFGDITTLMVWQKGNLQFAEFFALVVPSIVNWLVTAVIMSFALPSGKPEPMHEDAKLQHGALVVVGLFILTISMAVSMHNFLHLPPVIGMMTGLGFLKLFGYYLQRRDQAAYAAKMVEDSALGIGAMHDHSGNGKAKFYDIYSNLQ